MRFQRDFEERIEDRDAGIIDEETDLVGLGPLLRLCREARVREIVDEGPRVDAVFCVKRFG